MKKGKVMFEYLVQTATDAKTGLTIMQNVVEQETDVNQQIYAIDYIQHTYGKTPKYMLADNEYYKIESLEYAFYNGITPIIPDRIESMNNNGKNKDNPFAKKTTFLLIPSTNTSLPVRKKIKTTGQKMIRGILNDK